MTHRGADIALSLRVFDLKSHPVGLQKVIPQMFQSLSSWLTPKRVGGCGIAFAALLSFPTTAHSAEPTGTETSDDVARFFCQVQNGQHTVMYSPKSQPEQRYAWAIPEDMGTAWPAERRCNEISRRLESYRPDGLLELQTGIENGYNTVCVTTEAVGSCRIVFTVPPGQDPLATRDRVFNNLLLADQGTTTEGVTTFTEGSSILDDLGEVLGLPTGTPRTSANQAINLRPFLDAADGGTGTQLNQSGGRPLNPANF